MTKRRWLIIATIIVLLVLAALAGPAVMWWGSRAPEDEAARLVSLVNLEPGQVVAEIGAGGGEMARVMAPRLLPGGRLIVTELSEDALDDLRSMVAAENWSHVDVRRGAVDGTALSPGCCAVIYMRHVYHHFRDPEGMARALRVALADGGRLAVIDFPPQWLLGLISPLVQHEGEQSGHGITAQMLMDYLTDAGLAIERHEPRWTAGSFVVVARK
jgi:ubiquinone/menaquinone biosynthesis C-methylase UbiE